VKLLRHFLSGDKRVILDRPSIVFQGKGVEFDSSPTKLVKHPWMNNPNPEILKLPDVFWFTKSWIRARRTVCAGTSVAGSGICVALLWGTWSVMLSFSAVAVAMVIGLRRGFTRISVEDRIENAHNIRPDNFVLWGDIAD
jgi:hypothetical protein